MTDKSTTHVKVIKNGLETWIVKGVWAEMKENKDTNGFQEVANTPPEVIIQKKKIAQAEADEVVEEGDAVDSEKDAVTGEMIEVKKRGRKSKVNEDQE